jgi:hypothetical protein
MNAEIEALDRMAQRGSRISWQGSYLDELIEGAEGEAQGLRTMIRLGARPSAKRAIAQELALLRMTVQSAYARNARIPWRRMPWGVEAAPRMYGEAGWTL